MEIEKKKTAATELTAKLLSLRREAELIERTAQLRLGDNFNLKESNADCTSLRQIDLIETTTRVSKTLLREKDQVLAKVTDQLRKGISREAAFERSVNEEVLDIRHEAFEDVTTEVAVVDPKKQISDNLKTLLMTVKLKYEQLKTGDAQIQTHIDKIARMVMMAGSSMVNASSVRRGPIANNLDRVNTVIIKTVDALENLIQAQFDMLRKTSEQIETLISTCISEIWSILGRRATVNDDKLTLLQPLNGLNKTLIEKDRVLRSQYDKIERYIGEIKESRVQLEQGALCAFCFVSHFYFILEYEEFVANQKEVLSVPAMEDLEEALQYVAEDKKACIDRYGKKLEKTVVAQLARIGGLKDEAEMAGQTMEKMKNHFKDLLKQCTSCRSFMSRGAGFIQKLFGQTSGCDFTAYEKKHLNIFS